MSQPEHSLAASVLALVAQRPDSTQPASAHPSVAARKLGQQAAAKAAAAAGALALPPGPLGWLTILPEMLAVWRIQAQLVADIAALYGRSAELGQVQMLYCLFRHTAAQGLRDLVVRVGERVLVRPATTALMKQLAASIGIKLSERALGKSVARWMPLVGAAGVSAYAWYDTQQVGKAALELFEREMVVEG
jgi:hypothetical protein